MRKRIVSAVNKQAVVPEAEWLNLDQLVEVEITSEDAAYPVENALLPGESSGWRAAEPGEQTIRLLFAEPQALQRIRLHFVDSHNERTQEFCLRWSADGGRTFQDILRQQWNFSPLGTTTETEDLQVELPAVSVLELHIIPDISGGDALASLAALQLA